MLSKLLVLVTLSLCILAIHVNGNRFLDSFTKCEHTFSNGARFDLQPLARTAGRTDYIVHGDDKGTSVVFNICSDVKEVPETCRKSMDFRRGPAYLIAGDACISLAGSSSASWQPIDEQNPNLGVELVYTGGETCANAREPSSLRVRVLCDSTGQMGTATDYQAQQYANTCMFSVTVPSPHGCPKPNFQLDPAWSVVIAGIVTYIAVGCFITSQRHGTPLGVQSFPNKRFWINVWEGAKILFGATVSWTLLRLGLGNSRTGVGGYSSQSQAASAADDDGLNNDYEWSM